LVVLVDVMGFTIVIPLLGLYAERFGASPLTATLLVSVYAVCSLLSTPVIGKLSDQYGRKRLLMVSQAGTFAGFVMLAVSSSLWMVFAGRILDGLTAGNLSIAQAYISDHTAPENRAKAFGIIGIAFGIGFMFGPALGGWLGDAYGMHMPFIVAASLSAAAITATHLLLPRDVPPGVAAGAASPTGPGGRRPGLFDLATYAEYFRRPGVLPLFAQFFLFTFSFACFTSGFALFAERRFTTASGEPWGSREVGYLFAFSGLLGIILQGGLLGRLVRRFGELPLTVAGFVATVVTYVGLAAADGLGLLLVATTIGAFGSGVLRPAITSRLTQAVGRHEQGVVLGISGSLSSVAMGLAPPTGGVMLDQHWLVAWALVPAVVGAIGLAVTLVWPGRSASVEGAATAPPA
jgi:MFS family permease